MNTSVSPCVLPKFRVALAFALSIFFGVLSTRLATGERPTVVAPAEEVADVLADVIGEISIASPVKIADRPILGSLDVGLLAGSSATERDRIDVLTIDERFSGTDLAGMATALPGDRDAMAATPLTAASLLKADVSLESLTMADAVGASTTLSNTIARTTTFGFLTAAPVAPPVRATSKGDEASVDREASVPATTRVASKKPAAKKEAAKKEAVEKEAVEKEAVEEEAVEKEAVAKADSNRPVTTSETFKEKPSSEQNPDGRESLADRTGLSKNASLEPSKSEGTLTPEMLAKETIAPAVSSSRSSAKAESEPLKLETPITPDDVAAAPAKSSDVEDESPAGARPPAPSQTYVQPEPRVVITRSMSHLRPRLAKTLQFYRGKPLNTRDDSAWSVMHSILGYGVNAPVAINSPKGRRTNAVNWMCRNYPLLNRRLLYLDKGYIKGVEGPGYQGHPCQFLAMLAQINLQRDYPLQINGQTFSLEDLINSEMYTCAANRELTFKLIALSHYLPSDARWKNESGEVWDIPRILEAELSQPVNGAACGGTHRVMAISFAVRTRELRGEPIEGVYLRAKNYVRSYQRYAMSLRNRDGSFSTEWFKKRSSAGDKDRQLQTTGHLLEWMVYSLPRNELSDPRIVQSVEFLNQLMTRHRFHDWEVGPRGHALRALSLYNQRVFQQQRVGTPVVAAVPDGGFTR